MQVAIFLIASCIVCYDSENKLINFSWYCFAEKLKNIFQKHQYFCPIFLLFAQAQKIHTNWRTTKSQNTNEMTQAQHNTSTIPLENWKIIMSKKLR